MVDSTKTKISSHLRLSFAWRGSKSYLAGVIGGASKGFGSLDSARTQAAASLFERLLKSDEVIFFGFAMEGGLALKRPPDTKAPPGPEQVWGQTLSGGPRYREGTPFLLARLELTSDYPTGTEAARTSYDEYATYVGLAWVGSTVAFKPMIGLGTNQRLDGPITVPWFDQGGNRHEVPRERVKARIDLWFPKPVSVIKDRALRFFATLQFDDPVAKRVEIGLANQMSTFVRRHREVSGLAMLEYDLLPTRKE